MIVANIIWFLHVCLIFFIILTPFLPNIPWTFLVLHFTTVITLLVHWLCNNDACFLTFVESSVRGIDRKESFMHSLVSPVYDIKDDQVRSLVKNITPLLGLASLLRIANNWDVIYNDIQFIRSNNGFIRKV
jgi:hypothetical protein